MQVELGPHLCRRRLVWRTADGHHQLEQHDHLHNQFPRLVRHRTEQHAGGVRHVRPDRSTRLRTDHLPRPDVAVRRHPGDQVQRERPGEEHRRRAADHANGELSGGCHFDIFIASRSIYSPKESKNRVKHSTSCVKSLHLHTATAIIN